METNTVREKQSRQRELRTAKHQGSPQIMVHGWTKARDLSELGHLVKGSEYDDIVVTTFSLEFLECGGDKKSHWLFHLYYYDVLKRQKGGSPLVKHRLFL